MMVFYDNDNNRNDEQQLPAGSPSPFNEMFADEEMQLKS